jgi:hypothetical protein
VNTVNLVNYFCYGKVYKTFVWALGTVHSIHSIHKALYSVLRYKTGRFLPIKRWRKSLLSELLVLMLIDMRESRIFAMRVVLRSVNTVNTHDFQFTGCSREPLWR